MRRICYISGSRADFGLMRSPLQSIHKHPDLSLDIVVTGMHLSPEFGNTVREIEATGMSVLTRVPVEVGEVTGRSMASGIGTLLIELTDLFESERFDVVLLLGDRGEMLAGALAAIHANIPVAHVHGGERSGTVDEPIRHAISKLAHFHFTATSGARERLIRMGEDPERIFVTGAPGLDGLEEIATADRDNLCQRIGFDPDKPLALLVYHPVLQEWEKAGAQAAILLNVLLELDFQVLALMPNSDAGGRLIRRALEESEHEPRVHLETHLERPTFVSWMAVADVMVGNSSAGIIETPTLGLPVVNVGSRQKLREQSGNVIDCAPRKPDIFAAIHRALNRGRGHWNNVYGDGKAGPRIARLLRDIPIERSVLYKTNSY